MPKDLDSKLEILRSAQNDAEEDDDRLKGAGSNIILCLEQSFLVIPLEVHK